MADLVNVTITAPDVDWLAAFARALIEDHLAASANIIPTVRSVYTWQGQIEDTTEALAIIHTRAAHVPAIIDRTNAEHPYDTPHVIAQLIDDANPGYRQWILDVTSVDTGRRQ